MSTSCALKTLLGIPRNVYKADEYQVITTIRVTKWCLIMLIMLQHCVEATLHSGTYIIYKPGHIHPKASVFHPPSIPTNDEASHSAIGEILDTVKD